MKVAFYTLGCKVNQYETQMMLEQFESNNFEVVDPTNHADVYIVNSCTVTSIGDKKTMQVIRRFRSQNKNAIIVLAGCFPQAFPQKAALIKEADIITGNKNKKSIFNLVINKIKYTNSIDNNSQNIVIESNKNDITFEPMNITKLKNKTRAFIKIQDGCNSRCSYCIIPISRGRVRSKPLEDIKLEATTLGNNHKEIVLTGINLSSYGQDMGLNLIDAIETISGIDTIERIRVSSLEPEILTKSDIRRLSKIEKFCPQIHLCLQSGCDDTLSRMNRKYTTSEFKNIAETIRKYMDNSSITTDIMVGFPGETDIEFNETLNFIKDIGFARMHVFAYSKRDGTSAAVMKNQIPSSIKKDRSKQLIKIASVMQVDFLHTQIGLTSQVLFETYIGDGIYQGYSKNYTHVIAKSCKDIKGKIKDVIIKDINPNSVVADIIQSKNIEK